MRAGERARVEGSYIEREFPRSAEGRADSDGEFEFSADEVPTKTSFGSLYPFAVHRPLAFRSLGSHKMKAAPSSVDRLLYICIARISSAAAAHVQSIQPNAVRQRCA